MIFKVQNIDLIKNAKKTYLTAAVSAAGTTLTVKDNTGAVNAAYMIIGEIGAEGTEVNKINGAVTAGTSITATSLGFAHGIDTPVYFVSYNQVEFSRATSLTGTKTTLATNAIDPSEFYTYYEDTSNSTGYGFVRWKNSTSSVYSSYSGGVNYEYSGSYSSYDRQTLFRMKERVRNLIAENLDASSVKDDEIRDALNTKQQDIGSARHWKFYEAERSQSSVANQFAYTIDTEFDRVQHVVYDTQPLAPVSNLRWKNLHFDSDSSSADPSLVRIFDTEFHLYPRPSSASVTTALNGAVSSTTATTITVDATSSFKRGDYYRFQIDSEIIYATATTSTTFTGCRRGMEGTTAATHLDDATVTELNIVTVGQLKPVDLFLSSDKTLIPEPSVLETGAAAEIAYGTLKDKTLGDRLNVLYDKKFKQLEEKYSMKEYGQFPRIKLKEEIISDRSMNLNSNMFPKSVNT